MSSDHSLADARDGLRAIELGALALGAARAGDRSFKLIAAVNRLKGAAPRGPAIWELTFKSAHLVPEDDLGVVGAGGEWSVVVDLGRPDEPPLVIPRD
jgi:hypothetical protein